MTFTEYEQHFICAVVDRIDQLRVERGYSVSKLSGKANLSENTLKYIYKKRSFPTLQTLLRLCQALDITLWKFFLFQEAPFQFGLEEFDLLKNYEKLPEYSRQLIAELIKHMK